MEKVVIDGIQFSRTPCRCACHITPGMTHVVACCDDGYHYHPKMLKDILNQSRANPHHLTPIGEIKCLKLDSEDPHLQID